MATGPPPAPEMAGLQVPTASLTTRAGNVEAAGSLRVHNIPNPARFATNNSDALSQSVWSRKMLLSFGTDQWCVRSRPYTDYVQMAEVSGDTAL